MGTAVRKSSRLRSDGRVRRNKSPTARRVLDMSDSEPVDLESALEQAAASPQSTNIDGTAVTQHALADLAEIADRQAAAKAARKNHRGIRFTKLVPPGTR